MDTSKIKIHGGRMTAPSTPNTDQSANADNDAVPPSSHLPGQTFHPSASSDEVANNSDKTSATETDPPTTASPVTASAAGGLDIRPAPPSPQASTELSDNSEPLDLEDQSQPATGLDQLEATPSEVDPLEAHMETRSQAENQQTGLPVAAHQEPLHISQPHRPSWGRFAWRTLVWLMVTLGIAAAGALAAIYLYKI